MNGAGHSPKFCPKSENKLIIDLPSHMIKQLIVNVLWGFVLENAMYNFLGSH